MNSIDCPICANIFKSPLFLGCCGNSVCSDCYAQWRRPYCPLCRGKVITSGVQAPNRSLARVISDLTQSNSPLSTTRIPIWSIQSSISTSDVSSDNDNLSDETVLYFGAKVNLRTQSYYTQANLVNWTKATHPNIAHVFGALEGENNITVLCEYCELGSLANVMNSQRELSLHEIVQVMLGVTAALEYIVAKDYAHGCLNLNTVMLTTVKGGTICRDHVKLVDVGINFKQWFVKLPSLPLNISDSSSETNSLRYTLPFVAPELLLRNTTSYDVSSNTDMYSVGILLLSLCTGLPPVLLSADATPSIPAGIHKALQDIMTRCLLAQPRPTISEVTLRLRVLQDSLEPVVSSHLPMSALAITSAMMETLSLSTVAVAAGSSSSSVLMNAIHVLVTEYMKHTVQDLRRVSTALQSIAQQLAVASIDDVTVAFRQEYLDISIAVTAILNLLGADPVIAQQCSRMVIVLASDKYSAVFGSRIVDATGVEALLSQLQCHRETEEVAESILLALSRLHSSDNRVREKLVCTVGFEIIIRCMESLPDSMPVNRQACALICALASNANAIIIDKMCSSGACEAVVACVKNHIDNNTSVVEQGCAAISALAATTTIISRMKLGSSWSAEACVLALQKFPDNELVAMYSLCAITSISAMSKGYKIRLSNIGVCNAVLAAVSTFQMNSNVLIQVFSALAVLSKNHHQNLSHFVVSGALESVVNATNLHFDNESVVAHGVSVLASFFSTADAKLQDSMISGNNGICDLVSRAIDVYWKSVDVSGQVMGVLLGLLFFESETIKDEFISNALREKFSKLVEYHKGNKDLMNCGKWIVEILQE